MKSLSKNTFDTLMFLGVITIAIVGPELFPHVYRFFENLL